MEIRERKETRFSPGLAAQMLIMCAGVLAVLSYNGPTILLGLLEWLGLGNVQETRAKVMSGATAVILMTVAALFSQWHKRRLQPFRDSEATLEGTNALFLRPFFSDARIFLPNPFLSKWSGGISLDRGPLQPEEFVGRVLEPFLDVREVGGSSSTIGVPRLRMADEEWKTGILDAIHAASVIIVLPLLDQDPKTQALHGESTIWELRYLVESGWMERVVVLMPSAPFTTRKKIAASWERARTCTFGFGLELPPYDKRGEIFVLAREGEVWRPSKSFTPEVSSQKRLAAGLIEAVRWMAERHQFSLLDR